MYGDSVMGGEAQGTWDAMRSDIQTYGWKGILPLSNVQGC